MWPSSVPGASYEPSESVLTAMLWVGHFPAGETEAKATPLETAELGFMPGPDGFSLFLAPHCL